MLRHIFHAGVLCFNLYSIWFDQKHVDLPFPDTINDANFFFKARLIFLTQWCFLLQTFYYAVALTNDVIGSNKPHPKNPPIIRRAKDMLFILAFPLAAYVASTFWTIYAIDRELIFPSVFDSIFPSWLNHSMHTYILFFIIIELVTSFRKYPTQFVGHSLTSGFMIVYIFWINIIYFKYSIWVYPVLEVMNWAGRILFYIFSTSIIVVFYILGEKMNARYWAKEIGNRKKIK